MPNADTASLPPTSPAAAHVTPQGRAALSGEGPVLPEHRAMRRSGYPKATRAQTRWLWTFILVCFQESKYFERWMREASEGKEVVLFSHPLSYCRANFQKSNPDEPSPASNLPGSYDF